MKYYVIILIGLLLVSGCAQYLPIQKDIPVYPYGSFAKIKTNDKKGLEGELLAVSGDTLYLVNKDGFGKIYKSYKQDIKKLKLELAINSDKPVLYQVVPKVAISASSFQGFYAVYTTVPNILIAVFTHPNKVIARLQWKDLYKYSRYPQGIPPEINLNDISPPPLGFRAKHFPNDPVNSTLINRSLNSEPIIIDHPRILFCINEVGATDGDVLRIVFDGQVLEENIELDKNPICKALTLLPEKPMYLSIKTIDGGQNPKDIIKIVIEDGISKRTVFVETIEGQTKGLYLQLKP